MSDVTEIAQARKARIAAEIAKLDNFIAMAEALVRQSELAPNDEFQAGAQGSIRAAIN